LIELKNLIQISKYAGERFDLVQAGGGNSSAKLKNNQMFIKASGYLLSDISIKSGYSKVYTNKISNIINNDAIKNEFNKRKKEILAKKLVEEATINKINRPSIETLLHSTLYKYTLHTHPIVVNIIVIKKKWKEILLSIFKNKDMALVPYKTPGIDLALELNKVISNSKVIPKIIFLQNHGLIVSSNNINDIQKITEIVLERIEKYLKIDMKKYKLTNKISNMINSFQKKQNISYLSEDKYLNDQLRKNKKLFLQKPFCPDSLVFCGVSTVILKNLTDFGSLRKYIKKYSQLPKVIIYNKHLFFIAINIKKAKDAEEVMKFHIMVLSQSMGKNINFLKLDELSYLSNWEAEKFRQKI
jgi:rhamnose utilization protein RhaD (predicted bifunctional aldolase and dehydrogenase)